MLNFHSHIYTLWFCDTSPLFILMPRAVTKTELKMTICTPILLLQFSSLPPDTCDPVIRIHPSTQSLGIILLVFLQANKLTLQFRPLG